MSTFDESLHPRGQAGNRGQFRERTDRAPSGTLTQDQPGQSAADAHLNRIQELEDQFHQLWLSDNAHAAATQTGEAFTAREQLARTATDPGVLAALSADTVAGADLAVARNPHTPASVLHRIATDTGRDRAYEARIAALHHPVCDPATIREVWGNGVTVEGSTTAQHIDVAAAPNTPPDILRDLAARTYSDIAGAHPNFPDDALAEYITDPQRMHQVIGNPKLTAEQLAAAATLARSLAPDLDDTDSFDDDDDTMWAALTAAGVARHPNTTEETVTALLSFPDAHVRKTAKDRLTGNRITRSRALAEQEMREAGGTEAEITFAGDVAARRALRGLEWGQA